MSLPLSSPVCCASICRTSNLSRKCVSRFLCLSLSVSLSLSLCLSLSLEKLILFPLSLYPFPLSLYLFPLSLSLSLSPLYLFPLSLSIPFPSLSLYLFPLSIPFPSLSLSLSPLSLYPFPLSLLLCPRSERSTMCVCVIIEVLCRVAFKPFSLCSFIIQFAGLFFTKIIFFLS